MYAITPKGIGKEVGARSIQPDWSLVNGESFAVENFEPGMVLAEDGESLRQPTDNDVLKQRRENASLPADELEIKLLDMGLLDDVEAMAKSSRRWEIKWRRNVNITRTDPDLVAGAKQLWPNDYETKLDQLFGI